MSYCRFSTDDFLCDLYCYESELGFETHVASLRSIYTEPLPPPVSFDDADAYCERWRIVMDMLDRAERKPIGLPYDGQSFYDDNLEDFLARLRELKAVGYQFPDYVIESVEQEIAEENV